MEIRKLARSEFPLALLEIPEPPKNLWIIGNLPDNKIYTYLCVVGSRKNTYYGRDVCEYILSGLKGYPIVIVSGFAMGIDTIAHNTAINIGIPTVVLPGSGLSKEVMYPKTNQEMVDKIIETKGCLLSEFEPNHHATFWSFPRRNRLMAGISKGTLVIEASEKSGTLITARLTTEYNRDLFAVPGSIFHPNSIGANKLIKQGATPITNSNELLDALGFEQKTTNESLYINLSKEERRIVKMLRKPLSRDEIIQMTKTNASHVNSLLYILEIKEIIKEECGVIRLINLPNNSI
ncbi:MAG: DNA-processing protein DprA [Candidatus Paceibacterota bacterium]|jgi:DNA processing protein